VEYNNTLRDLLKETSRPADAFGGDVDSHGSGFVTGSGVASVDAQDLLEASEQVAANAVKNLSALLPCKTIPADAAGQTSCAHDFVTSFGKRAYRRPLLPDEVDALSSFYSQARGDLALDFPGAIKLVLQVMLQSPSFLYRWELGPVAAQKEGDLVRYTDYEIASRLSYMLWASMPDDALFAAAEAGNLHTPAQIEPHVRRMLADPKSADMLADFASQWLGLTTLETVRKDTQVYPKFDASLASAMRDENRAFMSYVWSDKSDGKLATLLTTPVSFVGGGLAALYGASATSASSPTTLNAKQRGGVLTQAAFLTTHAAPGGSHPIQRGKQIAERLLCIDLPIPPPNIPDLPAVAPNVTTRERFAAHGDAACAKACHSIIDPLGFAYENYDGIGGYRTTDNGKTVDASSSFAFAAGTKSFANALELGKLLADAPEVQRCMSEQVFRYAFKRRSADGDAGSLAAIGDAFGSSGFDVRELMVSIATSHSFAYRQPAAEEVLR
jgi:hypothetical protein